MLTVGKSSGALAVTGRADEGLGIVEYPGPGAGRAGGGGERGTGPLPVVPRMPAVPVADGAGPSPVVSGDGAGGAPGQMLTFRAGPARPGAGTDRVAYASRPPVRGAGPLGPHLRRRGLRQVFRQVRVAGQQSHRPRQAWAAGRDEPLDVPRAAAAAHRAGQARAIVPVRSVSRSHQVNRMDGAPGCLPEPRFPAASEAPAARGPDAEEASRLPRPARRRAGGPHPDRCRSFRHLGWVRASAAARSSASVVSSLSVPAQAM
jgi:hypothetical protein